MYKTASDNLQLIRGPVYAKSYFKSMMELVCEKKDSDIYDYACKVQTLIDDTVENYKSPPLSELEIQTVDKGKYTGFDLPTYFTRQKSSFIWYWLFFIEEKETFRAMTWFLIHCYNGIPKVEEDGSIGFSRLTEQFRQDNRISRDYRPVATAAPNTEKIVELGADTEATIRRFNARCKTKRARF